jgi:hypothetical protein
MSSCIDHIATWEMQSGQGHQAGRWLLPRGPALWRRIEQKAAEQTLIGRQGRVDIMRWSEEEIPQRSVSQSFQRSIEGGGI